MTFRRIERGIHDQPKHEPTPPDSIVLQWKDAPPSPNLTIYIGSDLGAKLRINPGMTRMRIFAGHGEDAGRMAIMPCSHYDGDFRAIWRGNSYIVYLTSRVSLEHFVFCPRTIIRPELIEIRGGMLIFSYSGIKP